jgi:hypothetical protein
MKAVETVRLCKNATGPEDSRYLIEKAVLQRGGRHMVQHRKTNGPVDPTLSTICRSSSFPGRALPIRECVARNASSRGYAE